MVFCFNVVDHFYVHNYFSISVMNLFSSYFILTHIYSNSVPKLLNIKINNFIKFVLNVTVIACIYSEQWDGNRDIYYLYNASPLYLRDGSIFEHSKYCNHYLCLKTEIKLSIFFLIRHACFSTIVIYQ